MTTLGVISDTHGLLRPEARAALASVDRILHAGDIDGRVVLQMLGSLAPITAVRGNMDRGAWARGLPEDKIRQLVADNTTGRFLGLIGEPHVYVLQLNMALDAAANP